MIRGCLNKASKVYSFKGLPNFEIGIVHPTLALEGSLRHTASAPEQVNDLVEQGVKVHFPSPQPVRKGPSLSEGTSYQNPAEGATMRTIHPAKLVGVLRTTHGLSAVPPPVWRGQ